MDVLPRGEDHDIRLAYCAGLFEGEGSFGFWTQARTKRDGTPMKVGRYPRLTVSMSDREPLAAFVDRLGGRIYGPYIRKESNRKPMYFLRLECSKAVEAMESMLPLLNPRRKEQYYRVMEATGRGGS